MSRHRINRPRKQGRKRWIAIGKVALAVIPVLALVWTVASSMLDREEGRRAQIVNQDGAVSTGYVRLESDALVDFVEGKWDVVGPRVRVRPVGLIETLVRAFDPAFVRHHGRTVNAATFLVIRNTGEHVMQKVLLNGSDNWGTLGPGDALAICVALEKTDGSSTLRPIPISEVAFVSAAGPFTRKIDGVPPKAIMTQANASVAVFTFYPPKVTSQD